MILESKGNWETADFQEKRVNKDMNATILLIQFNKCVKTRVNLRRQKDKKGIRIITYTVVVYSR